MASNRGVANLLIVVPLLPFDFVVHTLMLLCAFLSFFLWWVELSQQIPRVSGAKNMS